jgi:hypothetical protein
MLGATWATSIGFRPSPLKKLADAIGKIHVLPSKPGGTPRGAEVRQETTRLSMYFRMGEGDPAAVPSSRVLHT